MDLEAFKPYWTSLTIVKDQFRRTGAHGSSFILKGQMKKMDAARVGAVATSLIEIKTIKVFCSKIPKAILEYFESY